MTSMRLWLSTSLRSEISKKIGYSLAEAYDKKIFRTIALAAREAHPVTALPGPEPGGSVIRLGDNNAYNAQSLVDAFFEAASILDEKMCPVKVASLCCPLSVLRSDLSGEHQHPEPFLRC